MTKRRVEPPPIRPREFRSVEENDSGIAKLERRIRDLNELDVTAAFLNHTGADDVVRSDVTDTIREVFGPDSPEFREHGHKSIWAGPAYMGMSQAGILNGMELGRRQKIVILNGLIERLKEKREDLLAARKPPAPSAPFDALNLDPRILKKITCEPSDPPEIASGLDKFRQDHGDRRVALIMMQFTNTKAHDEIARVLKRSLDAHGILGLRADDKQYLDDLFPNVKVYMHACEFGIAVFERIVADDFNPNVSLEVGYMLGMGKDVLLLKDRTLKTLPTDLTGRLYKEFDTLEVEASLPKEVNKWLADKGLIKPGRSGSGP
ncbi:MAG TPA: hypothetical protein VNE39_21610 [Planctomycetota bacterium]|nr:hypothetical protein [Planctomycetota bacterium]